MITLADAIIAEDMQKVRALLRYGMDINQLDEYGFTPLIEAAIADHLGIARTLIEAGADANLSDTTGGTPLHWAVENNNLALAEVLLQSGADPNAYTLAGQPAITMALLRQHQEMKKLLVSAGANLDFAQDYINTKLLGHLFELVGTANIISPKNEYVEVDFEGFYLEVTLGLIADSLAQYRKHFAGRKVRQYAALTDSVIDVLFRAAQLIKYQQYRVDTQKHLAQIHSLTYEEPVIIPVGYEGHAITFIKMGNILVKCDRREDSRLYDNIVFYQITCEGVMSSDLIKNLVFKQQSYGFINDQLPIILGLKPVIDIKIPAQISGNCSWANVEACIPALYFLFFSHEPKFETHLTRYKNLSLDLFNQWREWSKDRALNFCIQSFHQGDTIRKACKAEILAAILFQISQENSLKNDERAEKILAVLKPSAFEYVLQNYVKSYYYTDNSDEGKNFMRLLQKYSE